MDLGSGVGEDAAESHDHAAGAVVDSQLGNVVV
jgi:hypothetical protein